MNSFPNFELVCFSMSGSNCCFLIYIQVSQETAKWRLSNKTLNRGFPSGSVAKNLPANSEKMGSISDSGRYHMLWSNNACVPRLLNLCSRAWEPQQLSPCATTAETQVPYSPCSATRAATAVRSLHSAAGEQPLLATARESPHSSEDSAQSKINNK